MKTHKLHTLKIADRLKSFCLTVKMSIIMVNKRKQDPTGKRRPLTSECFQRKIGHVTSLFESKSTRQVQLTDRKRVSVPTITVTVFCNSKETFVEQPCDCRFGAKFIKLFSFQKTNHSALILGHRDAPAYTTRVCF